MVVAQDPNNLGVGCGSLVERRQCMRRECPVDCVAGAWNPWGPCSTTCGDGISIRSRPITVNASFGGKDCVSLKETKTCSNDKACPVACSLGQWSSWSACSATCGNSTMFRNRSVLVAPANGGKHCGPLREESQCKVPACPVHCNMSAWSPWSACDKPCGGGSSQRTRKILVSPLYGGQGCGPAVEYRTCNEQICDADCKVGPWSNFTSCSQTCGGGTAVRTRKVVSGQAGNGTACPALNETKTCNTAVCPIDCQVGKWGPFGNCSASCNGGTKTRTRAVLVKAQHQGKVCPPLADQEECNTQPCPIPCQLSQWYVAREWLGGSGDACSG